MTLDKVREAARVWREAQRRAVEAETLAETLRKEADRLLDVLDSYETTLLTEIRTGTEP